MHRREFAKLSGAGMLSVLACQQAFALSLSDFTQGEATAGIKKALEIGANTAVNLLGQTDGFLANPLVRIPLPKIVEDASSVLRMMGQGPKIDELLTGMNRAAEAAVPQGKTILLNAVKSMTVQDAKQILTGGETSVTTFFADKTRSPLSQRFLPIVALATERVGAARSYNGLVERVAMFAPGTNLEKVEPYVTRKALDGLFYIIGEEEKKIRQNPVGAGVAILEKVFGNLR
jgi:hypothetical protein